MNKNIVISNSKGGAGKSTISEYLAMISSDSGLKTIMIDSGYQRHSTNAFLKDDMIKYNLLDGLKDKKILKKCIYKINDTLDIIPATINLNNFSDEFFNVKEDKKDLIFKSIIDPALSNYDICVFDTESSLGALTRNALILADILIIPICDKYSIDEAVKLLQTVNILKDVYSDYMAISKIFVLPVMKRFLSRDYIKVLNMARETLHHEFLLPVSYHSEIFVGDNVKAFKRNGKIYKDYEKSLKGCWII